MVKREIGSARDGFDGYDSSGGWRASVEWLFAALAVVVFVFFFQAEVGIRDFHVTGVQTCALPISRRAAIVAGGPYTLIVMKASWTGGNATRSGGYCRDGPFTRQPSMCRAEAADGGR